jgi:hypothetical protein
LPPHETTRIDRTLLFKVAGCWAFTRPTKHVTIFLITWAINHFFDVRVYARTLQVVKLKEQLSEAEKEIQRLSQQRAEPVRSNSTRSSSPSEETTMGAQAAFIGEFEMDEYGDVFNTPAFYYAQGIDWINQYI